MLTMVSASGLLLSFCKPSRIVWTAIHLLLSARELNLVGVTWSTSRTVLYLWQIMLSALVGTRWGAGVSQEVAGLVLGRLSVSGNGNRLNSCPMAFV